MNELHKKVQRLHDGDEVSFSAGELRSSIRFGVRFLECTVCGARALADLAILIADGWTWDWPLLSTARCSEHPRKEEKHGT